MSIIDSFWFWLFVAGLLLILTSILIGGSLDEMKGWIWVLFIVGCVFVVLGIIFAIVFMLKNKDQEVQIPSEYIQSPVVLKISNDSFQSPAKPLEVSMSPLGTPTKVSTNLPQAKRGFASTLVDLSSLAPETPTN